jgi:hypothetical protein
MKRNIAGLTIPVAIRVVLMWAAPFPVGHYNLSSGSGLEWLQQ